MHIELVQSFPESIRKALEEIENEDGVCSIWFIGSRANECYRENSDWDFICFIENEVSEKTERKCEMLDIIQVDPSGNYLLEGQALELRGEFKGWQWVNINKELAHYKSRITPPVDASGCFNEADVKIKQFNAFRVYQNNA